MGYIKTINKFSIISFLIIAGVFQFMGGLMGWVTAKGVDGWYQSLDRSSLTPPDFVFGVVWSALYLLLSIAFWRFWQLRQSHESRAVLTIFIIHMLLNWLWSPLFFIAHALLASVLLIFALVFSGAILLWLGWRLDKAASLVLIPYLCWLVFAGHLSHYILIKN